MQTKINEVEQIVNDLLTSDSRLLEHFGVLRNNDNSDIVAMFSEHLQRRVNELKKAKKILAGGLVA